MSTLDICGKLWFKKHGGNKMKGIIIVHFQVYKGIFLKKQVNIRIQISFIDKCNTLLRHPAPNTNIYEILVLGILLQINEKVEDYSHIPGA